MPKRDREQQDRHNAARRKLKQAGRKAIFCMEHIKTTHPDIVKEASKVYDYLQELYPTKHDLLKTEIYRNCLKNKPTANKVSQHATDQGSKLEQALTSNVSQHATDQGNKLEPVLNIPLMQIPTSTSGISTETVHVEEIPAQLPILTDEETSKLIRELQDDPDLQHFFRDEPTNQVTVSTSTNGTEPKTLEEEIDRVIREEFEMLGTDLPDIEDYRNDELLLQ